jgi:hypothetical protein
MAERRGHKPNRKHKRCKKTVAAGQLFCVGNHSTNDRRTYGTVWQHKATCPACYKIEAHVLIPQLAPNETMDYAISDKEGEMVVPMRTATIPSGSVVDRTASATSQSGVSVHSLGLPQHPPFSHPRPAPVKGIPMPSVSTMATATAVSVAKVISGVMPSPYTAWPTAIPQPRIPTAQPAKPTIYPTSTVPLQSAAPPPPLKESAHLPSAACVPLDDGELKTLGPLDYNVVLHVPRDLAACTHESRCIAPSGIKLHLRLARACQPANWCLEQRSFHSCLENIAGVKLRGESN